MRLTQAVKTHPKIANIILDIFSSSLLGTRVTVVLLAYKCAKKKK